MEKNFFERVNPLLMCRFAVKLPETLIPEKLSYYITEFKHENGKLSISIAETEEINIRDNFADVESIRKKINEDDAIVIEYFNASGQVALREVYEGIEYEGETYGGCCYANSLSPVSTTLNFTYKTRRNATTN